MPKEPYNPNAYLSNIKNVKRGLKARTYILSTLERSSANAKGVANETGMHYNVALHHLSLLQKEGIIEHGNVKPYVWVLTGAGQKRLTNPA
jgi:predicted ArsR family transcriptional regulator